MDNAVVCVVAEFVVLARVVRRLMVDDFYSIFIYDDDFSRAVVRVWVEPSYWESSVSRGEGLRR